jgi:hypothetical protein
MDANEDIALPPLLERLAADARDVFTEHVLSRFDGGDLAVLALVSRSTRDAVFTSSVGEVNDLAAVRRELARVPNFVGSVGRLAWAKERGCPWNAKTFTCIAEDGGIWRSRNGRRNEGARGTSGLAPEPRKAGT